MVYAGLDVHQRMSAVCTLLFPAEVPPVYVPNQDVRAWRRLIVFHNRLSEGRPRVKNRLRNLLRQPLNWFLVGKNCAARQIERYGGKVVFICLYPQLVGNWQNGKEFLNGQFTVSVFPPFCAAH